MTAPTRPPALDLARVVAVFGASHPTDGSADYALARRVGRVLGGAGCTVATGGYGGAMEAVSRGAREAGGRAIGVTCSIWKTPSNRYIDQEVRTDGLDERVAKLVELATVGFVVLPGATGTLAELARVWEAKSVGDLADRPLVCLGGFWRPVVRTVASQRPAAGELVRFVDDPEDLATVLIGPADA